MINIKDKSRCCGCEACRQVCPRQCITMEEDSEGYAYPQVDAQRCINCGMCETVCPFTVAEEATDAPGAFAVKNTNDNERMDSSSGGLFIALAKSVIDGGGVVFGAVFDKEWGVAHTHSETVDGARAMMGSKYVQSRIGYTYQQAEDFLKAGCKVMFTGTPCQIAGLHNYLRKGYDNLLSVDIVCHGVPSPGAWRRYIGETLGRNARKEGTMPAITSIDFRDKRVYGWKNYSLVICGASPAWTGGNAILLSDKFQDNPFMGAFLSDMCLRPSCYSCSCKGGMSHSDITIGDFWGVWDVLPGYDDDKGTSIALVHSAKGMGALGCHGIETTEVSLADALALNQAYSTSAPLPAKKRARFFKRFESGDERIEDIVKDIQGKAATMWKVKYRLKRAIKKLSRK